VVATRVGGVPEVVLDGVTGLLSERDDRQALATHLASLLFDRPRARAMGRAGRSDAVERFERSAIVARYEDLYRRVLAHAPRR
jgi:glycosyltransferase involved in cell wall biosynthesis